MRIDDRQITTICAQLNTGDWRSSGNKERQSKNEQPKMIMGRLPLKKQTKKQTNKEKRNIPKIEPHIYGEKPCNIYRICAI